METKDKETKEFISGIKKSLGLISIPFVFILLMYLLNLCLAGISAASNIALLGGLMGLVILGIIVFYLFKFYKKVFS